MLFTHLFRVRDDLRYRCASVFYLHILFSTVFLTFWFWNFVLCVEESVWLAFLFFFTSCLFCQFYLVVAVVFPLRNSVIILFNVAGYCMQTNAPGALYCSRIYCDMLWVFFCLFESFHFVLSCHVYAIICFTIYNEGEGP